MIEWKRGEFIHRDGNNRVSMQSQKLRNNIGYVAWWTVSFIFILNATRKPRIEFFASNSKQSWWEKGYMTVTPSISAMFDSSSPFFLLLLQLRLESSLMLVSWVWRFFFNIDKHRIHITLHSFVMYVITILYTLRKRTIGILKKGFCLKFSILEFQLIHRGNRINWWFLSE